MVRQKLQPGRFNVMRELVQFNTVDIVYEYIFFLGHSKVRVIVKIRYISACFF